MAALTVRNVKDSTVATIRVRAAQRGRSMESVARELFDAYAEDRLVIRPRPEAEPTEDELREVDARIAATQAAVRELLGGELPKGAVDAFLKEKREEALREE